MAATGNDGTRARSRGLAVAAWVAMGGLALFQPGAEREARADITGLVQNPANGHYYKYVSQLSNWATAKSAAEALGGYLVTLTSLTELNWVIQNVGNGGGDVWIGATDSAQEGNWVWITGEPWSYSNWNAGEPNNSGGEHWIEMYTSGKWNDVPASHNNPGYVIEWDEDPNAPPPPVTPADPSNLTATLSFSSTIQLQWQDHSDNESAFEVERKTDSTPWVRISRPAKNTTAYEDGSLAPLTEYTYRVRAVNGVGPSAYSNEAAETSGAYVPVTPAPSDLAVASVSPTTADIQWADNSNGEIGFEVWRRKGSGPFVYLLTTASNATTFHDGGLTPDTEVAWQVRSVGTVSPSGFVTITTYTAPTLGVDPVRGDLKDSPRFGKDSLKLVATWEFLGDALNAAADPVAHGITIRAGLDASPILLKIPANFDGWKGKGPKYKWKSTGAAARYSVKVDLSKNTVTLVATGLEWEAAAANPVRVSLAVGDDAGTERGEWEMKKPGYLRLR